MQHGKIIHNCLLTYLNIHLNSLGILYDNQVRKKQEHGYNRRMNQGINVCI
jgi:hypothetical protein